MNNQLNDSPHDHEANIVSAHYFKADEGIFGEAHNPMEKNRGLPGRFCLGDMPLSLLIFCVLILAD